MASDLQSLVACLRGQRVLVVGDLCLDEYLVGQPERLSREAPVPVLSFQRGFTLPGAAANPAQNVRALGSEVLIAGVVGDDDNGRVLRQHLAERGIDQVGVVIDPTRATTHKLRVMAESSLRYPQQVARIDRQDRHPISASIQSHLAAFIRASAPTIGAILLSDYRSGVIGREIVRACLGLEKHARRSLIVTADSQGDLRQFRGITAIKVNQQEAEYALGHDLCSEAAFESAGRELVKELEVQAVLITRGPDGMSLITGDGSYLHIPTANASEVFDVTGAGDTVIAVLTLGLCAGASLGDAARLANAAAGLVVRKLGNATLTPEELAAAVRE